MKGRRAYNVSRHYVETSGGFHMFPLFNMHVFIFDLRNTSFMCLGPALTLPCPCAVFIQNRVFQIRGA